MYSMETLVRESVELMNLVLSDKFEECFIYLFFWKVREHKTNCHVLQDPRKMSGHQKVTCGRRVSDLSRTRELESKDKFPFEALGWDRRRKSQRAMTRICSDLSR